MAGLMGTFLGGVGLFLLGMRLMTDGLKMAAGGALRHILGQWTRTPLRGLFSGILITALVQSSSAVTVATIGFVNAGLMTLAQSIGIIYGSNVGTTMTGWLVVLLGFKVDIQALALPLIGLGMGLEVLGRGRYRHLGQALAGFGLFFLGIAILKGAFETLGQDMPIAEMVSDGLLGMLLFAGIGVALTLLMQSSSAAFALVLAATAGSLIPLTTAAAAVIGANVGTTSTAAFAVIGATANARRVAAAHVVFNLATATAAFLMLPLILATIPRVANLLGLESSPATVLALFHTAFNVLGVVLLWPLTPRLVGWLETRFRLREEDLARPRYLDRNVAGTPALALPALALEVGRIGAIAWGMARSAISVEGAAGEQMAVDRRSVRLLGEAVGEFSVQMQKAELPAEIGTALPELLRTARYYNSVAEMAVKVADLQAGLEPIEDAVLAAAVTRFRGLAAHLLQTSDPTRLDQPAEEREAALRAFEEEYQAVKAQLLRAGTDGRLKVRQMVGYLDQYSVLRRMLEQSAKGARRLAEVSGLAARYNGQPAPAEPLQALHGAAGES